MKYERVACPTCGMTRNLIEFYQGGVHVFLFAKTKAFFLVAFFVNQTLFRVVSFCHPHLVRFDIAQFMVSAIAVSLVLNS